ncbi:MAG TPA: type II secretion system protein [Geobacterales bacterium]|nr:type II secretion system protein [Geobacterales bacterium]
MSPRHSQQGGFTYLAVLMLVLVMAIMLSMAGESWQNTMRREREAELLFRGKQMKDALTRWHNPNLNAGGQPRTKLTDLKFLLSDPRTAGTARHLRRLYTDPITGEEWQTIMSPTWGIIGVKSSSDAEPLKQGGFPSEFAAFEGKKKYSEWEFRFQ